MRWAHPSRDRYQWELGNKKRLLEMCWDSHWHHI
jgi:hypothetical protein